MGELCEDLSESVVRGNAIRQLRKGFEPAPIRFPPKFDFSPVIRPADDGEGGNHQNVELDMLLRVARPVIGKGSKILGDGLLRLSRHGSAPANRFYRAILGSPSQMRLPSPLTVDA